MFVLKSSSLLIPHATVSPNQRSAAGPAHLPRPFPFSNNSCFTRTFYCTTAFAQLGGLSPHLNSSFSLSSNRRPFLPQASADARQAPPNRRVPSDPAGPDTASSASIPGLSTNGSIPGSQQHPTAGTDYLEWNEDTSETSGDSLLADSKTLDSTVRLVETAMLAATAGLAFFLSNLLTLESYFGSFFPLPIVISSVRWGASAGRKTMMATALLLFVLSGPLKALSYLLVHGFVGLAIGSLWRWRVPWTFSILLCALARCGGLILFVMVSSFLVQENLLALLTANAHASVSHLLASMGSSLVPTMGFIYGAAAVMLAINCVSFVALLHILYAVFLRRLGLRAALAVPHWVERAL